MHRIINILLMKIVKNIKMKSNFNKMNKIFLSNNNI